MVLGTNDIFQIEARTILEGLKLAWWNANKIVNCITKANGDIIEQLVILDDPSQYVRCWLEEDIRLLLVATDNFH
ncbi:hypothetical protein Goshw_022013 [Gossypium schwendimanii]|uniref:Uncharacterized protein n=1 Tax=Gossypium schwendimanii TaxID=34291 RepID=A0A7J9KYH3_GOSSC|nr:hypothetical protein [Gossypium schwendimanii]